MFRIRGHGGGRLPDVVRVRAALTLFRLTRSAFLQCHSGVQRGHAHEIGNRRFAQDRRIGITPEWIAAGVPIGGRRSI
jgi:hypothetical protein